MRRLAQWPQVMTRSSDVHFVKTRLTMTLALLVGLAPAARAQTPTVAASGTSASAGHHYVGLTLDVGLPDILGLAIAARPAGWLRLFAGGSTDLFSGGIGGGATLIPLRTMASPSLTVEGGHVFAAATHGIPQKIGIPVDGQRIGYDYFDAHAGLEVGAQKRVSFFLHAGISYIDMSVRPEGANAASAGFKDASLRIWGPSAKLGLSVFL
jgi:hypothetical protein